MMGLVVVMMVMICLPRKQLVLIISEVYQEILQQYLFLFIQLFQTFSCQKTNHGKIRPEISIVILMYGIWDT